MLKVEHVTKYYDDIPAVIDESFTVKEGEIFGLLGVNGAGKTTTFRMILGLLSKNEGIITLNGKNIDYTLTDKIGFLSEERSLLTKMTVSEQIHYYGKLKGMKNADIDKKLDYYLKRFNILEYKNRVIKELSKGNQQKIQFISAIMNDPILLILDEPFSGLDPINIELFKSVILEMKEKGCMIIFSTHRMDHAEYFCDKLLILVKGKTVLEGDLKEIKRQYRKKNIIVIGEVIKEKILSIKGVESIDFTGSDYIIKVSDDGIIDDVFKTVSKFKNVTKFVVEEPSLNEIFLAKVGEYYE